ncbi:MAG: Bbp16 family capsid cement protein [Bdellovibrio sp.]
MLFDVQNQLCTAQAFTGAATVSTDSYAKQTAAQDISIGCLMAILCMPTVSAGAGSTATLEAIQADDAALTSNVQVLNTVTVAAANFTKGSKIPVPIPPGSMNKQYLGLRVTLAGGVTTVTLDAYLVPQEEIPVYKSFPKVINPAV